MTVVEYGKEIDKPGFYCPKRHRETWVMWISDIYRCYEIENQKGICVQLCDQVLLHQMTAAGVVQCRVAACISLVSKAAGLCFELKELVELGDGAFSLDDLIEAEFFVIGVITFLNGWSLLTQTMKISNK